MRAAIGPSVRWPSAQECGQLKDVTEWGDDCKCLSNLMNIASPIRGHYHGTHAGDR